MKVLLIGSGGREHALAWAISKSDLCETLFCAPGNAGIAELAECVLIDAADHDAVTDFAREQAIDLVVVGPEAPLVAGLVDHLADAGIRAFGPSRAASMLEGSKGFTKDLCERHGIPTASYARFSDLGLARAHAEAAGAPIVIKADGLAAGKGVTVAETVDEALEALDACFAVPGAEVVIEEKMEGEEASFFALVDGRTAVPFGGAQDHKRAFDGDEGPNTGGMGAYSPAPVLTPEIEARIMAEIVEPTVAAMWEEGAPFTGILFAGIMVTDDGPKLIEYNVRFGDPEAQVLIMRLESDLLGLMQATVEGRLGEAEISWRDEAALAVVMAGRGYPGEPARGGTIGGLEKASAMDGVAIFHAATRVDGDRLVADGGRVLAVAARGTDVREARDRAYAAIARIDWEDGFCRSDIGHRALARQGG